MPLLCSVVTGVPLVWCSPGSRLGVPGKSEGTIFTPVQCQIGYYEPERVGGVGVGGEGWEWEGCSEGWEWKEWGVAWGVDVEEE